MLYLNGNGVGVLENPVIIFLEKFMEMRIYYENL